MELDSIDKKLLYFLQEDSKQTTKELSHKLDLSVTAVYERIKKLEKLLDNICGNLDEPGTGILFTLPVDYARGLMQDEEEESSC